jgi:hypothetical protein
MVLCPMQNDHHVDEQQTVEQVFTESCCTPPSKKGVTFNSQQNKCYKRRGALWNKHELFYTQKELQEMKNDATIQAQKITDEDSEDGYKLFRGYEGITSLEIYKQRSSNRKRSRQIVFEEQNNDATATAIAESYHEITRPSIDKALEVGQYDEMEATKVRYQDFLVDAVSEAQRIRRQRLLAEQQQHHHQQQEKDNMMLLMKHFTTTPNNAHDVSLKSHDSATVSTPSTASSNSSTVSNEDEDHPPTIKTSPSSSHTFATETSPSDEFQYITISPDKTKGVTKKPSSRMVAKSFFGKLLRRSTTAITGKRKNNAAL